MAKRVILAVAGAGKTYRICHEMQPEQKNLIVAFTHANIKNIQNELLKEHGKIPDATRIMTFDAFVYHMIIRPYEKTIYNFFGQNYKFEKTSITLKKPPQQRIKINGRYVPNKSYKKKDCLQHYMDERGQYYCETLSELAMYRQKMQQFKKDGFIDRYSGDKLVNPGFLKVLSHYMPEEFPYHSHWKMEACHNAYWECVPTVDHI